jgi:type II secretory pathway predicted ATPase ExeA
VLFVEEAHDLHFRTLRGLKRLCEVVADGGAVLSIVLAGHPKLRNALLGPNMEEIGSRFAVFPFEGMAGHQAGYIAWLIERCRAENAEPAMIIEPAAIELLAARLRTPLQTEQYLTRVFEPRLARSYHCHRDTAQSRLPRQCQLAKISSNRHPGHIGRW